MPLPNGTRSDQALPEREIRVRSVAQSILPMLHNGPARPGHDQRDRDTHSVGWGGIGVRRCAVEDRVARHQPDHA
jgi:hypothetical protein